jgi:hypothetical protein
MFRQIFEAFNRAKLTFLVRCNYITIGEFVIKIVPLYAATAN